MIKVHCIEAIRPTCFDNSRGLYVATLTDTDAEIDFGDECVGSEVGLIVTYDYEDNAYDPTTGISEPGAVSIFNLYVASASHPEIAYLLSISPQYRKTLGKQLRSQIEHYESAIYDKLAYHGVVSERTI